MTELNKSYIFDKCKKNQQAVKTYPSICPSCQMYTYTKQTKD